LILRVASAVYRGVFADEPNVLPKQLGRKRATKRRKAGMHIAIIPTLSSSGEKMPLSMLS